MKTLILAISLLCCFATAGSAQPSTLNPSGALQGADHYTFRVGDIEITSLSDGTVPQDLHVLLLNTTDQHTDQLLRAAFLSNPVEASINAFFFRTAGKAVLVDTGAGDFFGPGYGGKLLQSLTAIHVNRPRSRTSFWPTRMMITSEGSFITDSWFSQTRSFI